MPVFEKRVIMSHYLSFADGKIEVEMGKLR